MQKVLNTMLLAVLLVCLSGCGRTDRQQDAVFLEEQTDSAEEAPDDEEPGVWYVEINGAVKKPGVYPVKEGCRIFEVVELAGGFTKNACLLSVNQAEAVKDEQQIYVYTKKEWKHQREQEDSKTEPEEDGKVNLNTADRENLMTLPGIGSAKADAIVAYREQKGLFQKPEDIMKVTGIKEGVFRRIEEFICVTK